jgi:hypothetical protein
MKEITDPLEREEVFSKATHLFLAMADEPAPYLVPLFYGYEEGTLYIHCARKGRKLDLLRGNPRVGFALAQEPSIVGGETACAFSARSRSIIGHGEAREVSDDEERRKGLDAIMRHYDERTPMYEEKSLARTCVLAVDIKEVRGKRIG